jgi:hypothetical protein
MLRKILEPEGDGVRGVSEELSVLFYNNYYSVNEFKNNKMGEVCGAYGGVKRCIQALVGRPEGKEPLGRPRRRWGNITREAV